jgi:hypothetical protein
MPIVWSNPVLRQDLFWNRTSLMSKGRQHCQLLHCLIKVTGHGLLSYSVGTVGVSTFPPTDRSQMLAVHFNTRAYQASSFSGDLTSVVKVTGSGELSAWRAYVFVTPSHVSPLSSHRMWSVPYWYKGIDTNYHFFAFPFASVYYFFLFFSAIATCYSSVFSSQDSSWIN